VGDGRGGLLPRPIAAIFKHFSLDSPPPSAGWLRVYTAPTCACGKVQATRLYARPPASTPQKQAGLAQTVRRLMQHHSLVLSAIAPIANRTRVDLETQIGIVVSIRRRKRCLLN